MEDSAVDLILERRRRAAAAMSLSYMSNAKWRKALSVLAGALPGGMCRWKILRDPDPVLGWLPHPGEVDESHLGCSLLQAPYFVLPEYRDIEWLEIPAEIRWQLYENAPFCRTELDLSKVRCALESVGKFELEQSEHGLRLYGYRP